MKHILMMMIALAGSFYCAARQSTDPYEGYNPLEIETEKCLDEWIKNKGVKWDAIKPVFELYFSDAFVSDPSLPLHEQYLQILKYWEKPVRGIPVFPEGHEIGKTVEKLGLSEEAIMKKKQLACFTNIYIANKTEAEKDSSFYAFGSTLEAIRDIPDISLALVAGALRMLMDPEDLKKSLYQKTIVLLFCFDMTL